jgi:transposase
VSTDDDRVRIVIADAPRGPFEKCKAGPNLIVSIIINKYIDHLPIDRQLKSLSKLGAEIAPSTVTSWLDLASENLRPLYAVMRQLMYIPEHTDPPIPEHIDPLYRSMLTPPIGVSA